MIKKILFLSISMLTINFALAQEIIKVQHEKSTEITWEGGEKAFFAKDWNTPVVTNVSVPTMEVFRPKNPNGTAVIIAPGGGLYALSIKSEGTDVAKWLTEQGVTAFVLKYRLVPTGENGVQEITNDAMSKPERISERVAPIMPLSIADALSSINYVRENATAFDIASDKLVLWAFQLGEQLPWVWLIII